MADTFILRTRPNPSEENAHGLKISRLESHYNSKNQTSNIDFSELRLPKTDLHTYLHGLEKFSTNSIASNHIDSMLHNVMDASAIHSYSLTYKDDLFGRKYSDFNIKSDHFTFNALYNSHVNECTKNSDPLLLGFRSEILDSMLGMKVQVTSNGHLSNTFITPTTSIFNNTQLTLGITPDGKENFTQISREIFPGVLWQTERLDYSKYDSESRQGELLKNKLIFKEGNQFNLPSCESALISDSRWGTYLEGKLFREIDTSSEKKLLSLKANYFPDTSESDKRFTIGLEYFRLKDRNNTTEFEILGNVHSDKKVNFEFYLEKKY